MRRAWFWALLGTALAAAAVWVISVPYCPQRVYAAIPRDAFLTIELQDPAAHVDALAENPVTRRLLAEAGLDIATAHAVLANPGRRRWVERLAGRLVLMARVPLRHAPGRSGWVAASWVGGWSQILRWMASVGCLPVDALGSYNGHTMWRMRSGPVVAERNQAPRILFALGEGVLVMAPETDPECLCRMLDAMDLGAAMHRDEIAESMQIGDRDWTARWKWRMPFVPVRVLWGDVDCITSNGIRAALTIPWLKTSAPPAVAETGRERISTVPEDLFGDAPLLICGIDGGLLDSLCGAWMDGGLRRWVEVYTQRLGVDRAGIVLMGGEYRGRLFGVRWPGVVLVIHMQRRNDCLAALSALIDELNAGLRWGLVPRAVDIGGEVMYVVESTAGTPYARLPAEERVAYVQYGDWLLVSPSSMTLRRIFQNRNAARPNSAAPLRTCLDPDGADPFCLWCDFGRAEKVIRQGLAVYTLKLMMEGAQGRETSVRNLNRMRAWVHAMAGLGRLQAAGRQHDGQGFSVEIVFGKDCNARGADRPLPQGERR